MLACVVNEEGRAGFFYFPLRDDNTLGWIAHTRRRKHFVDIACELYKRKKKSLLWSL